MDETKQNTPEKGDASTFENGLEDSHPMFMLGQAVITNGALWELDPNDVMLAMARHRSGDWGEVCPEDWATNEEALAEGHRLLSVYQDRNGTRFWIITEWDRSVTTVLLPSEY